MVRWTKMVVGVLAAAGPLAGLARADLQIGNWENGSSDQWIDWGTQSDYAGGATSLPSPKYSFSNTVGVTSGSSSLQLNQAGWNQDLAVKLEYIPGAMAEFFKDTKFAVDVTYPATTTAGWQEIYEFAINATNYGWNDQLGNPLPGTHTDYGPNGGPARTYTLVMDYSKLVSQGSIPANAGWVEFILATNSDPDHGTFYFDNARLAKGVSGDANLDGTINGDDYTAIDRGFARYQAGTLTSPGWTDGDFNGDGKVDAADYLLMDTDYGKQTGQLPESLLNQREAQFGAAYVAALSAAVPEPASLGVLGAAMLLGLRRRRAGGR